MRCKAVHFAAVLAALPFVLAAESRGATFRQSCPGLTLQGAAQLVRIVVTHQTKHERHKTRFTLDSFSLDDPEFFDFEAIAEALMQPSSAVLGNYAVNKQTATVWDLSTCERVSFGELNREKTRLCKGTSSINQSLPRRQVPDPSPSC